MGKIRVNNICGVGIIYRRANPSEIFIEVKDDGYPQKLMRRKLCPIGGNWIGERAKRDSNPYVTFTRELGEELSFERPIRDTVELYLLGQAEVETFSPTPVVREAETEDKRHIEQIKAKIVSNAMPFADFVNSVSKAALDSADPQNTRDGYAALASYYASGLEEETWRALCELQKAFGNLSNESITLITTLDEIIRTGTKTAFGHDRALKAFFLQMGLEAAKNFPLLQDGVDGVWAGASKATYDEYLLKYDVLKKP